MFGLVVLVLAGLLAAEGAWPLTPLRHGLVRRWANNTALFAVYQPLLAFVVPATAAAGAAYAASRGWGLFHLWHAPTWVVLPVTLMILDGVDYATHRIEHAVPLLWRLHRTHHSDPDMDMSTGLRFHPVEVLVRGGATALAMVLLGAPLVIATGCSLFVGIVSLVSHTNTSVLPIRLQHALQHVVVTPRMHRIHHSIQPQESAANYGAGLAIWDRWLGTYRGEPQLPFGEMQFGVHERSASESLSLGRMLTDPVRG